MSDEFEEFLRKQPLRPAPEAWRAEILAAARAGAVQNEQAVTPWWKALLWPSPLAWAGVACAWVLIAGMNIAARTGAPEIDASLPSPPSADAFALMVQERAALEEVSQVQQEPAAPAQEKPMPPGACIDRREERGDA